MNGFDRDMNKKILFLIAEFFEYDLRKTMLWFCTQNPHLGEITPLVMLQSGRAQKLLKFIENQIEGNMP